MPFKISVTSCEDWRTIRTVRIGVSMNNPNFEGDKLCSLLDWSKQFPERIIQVTDSLNRHNNGGNSDAARRMGDDWLHRNQSILQTVDHKLVRWDDLLAEARYADNFRAVNILYENDRPFRFAVQTAASKFVERYPDRTPDRFVSFALEEVAGYRSVWGGQPHVKPYPAKEPEWWRLAKNKLVANQNERWAYVRFQSKSHPTCPPQLHLPAGVGGADQLVQAGGVHLGVAFGGR